MHNKVFRKTEAAVIATMTAYLGYRFVSCEVSPWDAWSPEQELSLWGYFIPWISIFRVVRQSLELRERRITDFVFSVVKLLLWGCMGIHAIANVRMYPAENGNYYPGGNFSLYLIPIGLAYFIHWIVRCICNQKIPTVTETADIWKKTRLNMVQKLILTGRKVIWHGIYIYTCCGMLYQMIRLCPVALAFEFIRNIVIPVSCLEIITLLAIPGEVEP